MKSLILSVILLFSSFSFASYCPNPEDFNCHRPKNCQDPWGNTLADGQSVYAYAKSTAPTAEECESELRTCENGHLTGSYESKSCRVSPDHESPDQSHN